MAKFRFPNATERRQQAQSEPVVDPVALEAFAAGARDRRGANEEPPPWAQYNPEALPRYNVTLRMNEYQLEMLRYLTGIQETSQSKFLQKLVLPIIKQRAEEIYAERGKS